ncbi:MAG: hypothetical protein AB2L14_05345 [Candidatus Xenobiia bacterium LiM19]
MSFFGTFKDNINKMFLKKASAQDQKKDLRHQGDTLISEGSTTPSAGAANDHKAYAADIIAAKNYVKIHRDNSHRLDFISLFNGYHFFSVNTVVNGDLASFMGEKDKKGMIPAISELPVKEKTIRIETSTRSASPPDEEYTIKEAAIRENESGHINLHFTFSKGPQEEVYIDFHLPGTLEPENFVSVHRVEKVFERIPPVSHMGMLLKTFIMSTADLHTSDDSSPLLTALLATIPNDNATSAFSALPDIEDRLRNINTGSIDFLSCYLASHKVNLSSHYLMALALFVETEIGIRKRENLEALDFSSPITISPYSTMAIADACDIKLKAFDLGSTDGLSFQTVLSGLLGISSKGLIVQVVDQAGEKYFCSVNAGDNTALYDSPSEKKPTGLILCLLPVIDHLNRSDIETILKSRHPIMTSFQSDFDKKVMWKKLTITDIRSLEQDAGASSLLNSGSLDQFYSGFRSYNFMKTMIGGFVDSPSTEAKKDNDILIFRDSRGSRQYVHLESSDAVDTLLQKIPADWSAGDEKILFPTIEALPEHLYEAPFERLLNKNVDKTKDELTLEKLYPELSGILTVIPSHVKLESRSDLKRKVKAWLLSSDIQQKITKHISSRTLEAMLKYLDPGSGDNTVEINILESLAEAEEYPEIIPIAASLIMSALCQSELTEVKSYFKSFDDKNFHFQVRNMISELMDSQHPELRALAVELVAARSFVSTRNDVLMVEYDIERGLSDSNQTVREHALTSKLHLLLRKRVPLLRPVEITARISENIPIPENPASRQKSSQWEEQNAKDIQTLLQKLDDYIDNIPKTGKMSSTGSHDSSPTDIDISLLPYISQRESKMQLATLIAGINVALKADENQNRSRYLFVVSQEQIDTLMESVLVTWKDYIDSEGKPFTSLIRERTPETLMRDFSRLAEERFVRDQKAPPFFGGNQTIMIHRVEPLKYIKAIKTIENKKVSIRRKKMPHKFLVDLIMMGSEFGLKNLRICRATKAGGVPLEEIENTLTAFPTQREIFIEDLEVFNPQSGHFIPLFHILNIKKTPFEDQEDSWDTLNLMLELYDSISRGKKLPVHDEESEPHEAAAEEEQTHIGGASTEMVEIARQIAKAFLLPESTSRQILNIVFEAMPDCPYNIWG